MRIACISDAHGNVYALEKALKYIKTLNIDEVIFMGDAVGYIPGIQALKYLKALNIICLMGNHENMLLNKKYTAQKDKIYQHDETLSRSKQYSIDYIKSWPTKLHKDKIAFFHASPDDHLNGYIYPDTDLNFQADIIKKIDYCIIGHTHRPFIRSHENTIFINTGSVGLPRDDGRYGAFAVIDTDSKATEIMRFDITAETKRSINEFGPVHNSVLNLTNRHAKEPIIGDMIND